MRRWLLTALLLAASVPVVAADVSPQPAPGWRYEVFAENQPPPAVDNLAIGGDGGVYATLELSRGRGRVVRIRNGTAEDVVTGLNRPDGLFAAGKFLYITEEILNGRVLEFNLATRVQRTLATLNMPEGIGRLPGGDLVISEDSPRGRLLRLEGNGTVEIINDQLNRPEGLSVAPDGTVYVAETARGRLLAVRGGQVKTVIKNLTEPDQVKYAPDDALWITEDADPGRLLRFKNGALETIMSGLAAPQGMAFRADGAILLAEQGNGRILVISKQHN